MNVFEIDIQNDTEIIVDAALLRGAAVAALTHQQIAPPGTMVIVLTDDAAVQTLNLTYRGEDKPTDVLSFADGDAPFPGAAPHLGDLIIALPYATRQAERLGNALSAELQLLTVHGTLHLLGHDHGNAAEKATMWQAQAEILDALGCHVTLSHA